MLASNNKAGSSPRWGPEAEKEQGLDQDCQRIAVISCRAKTRGQWRHPERAQPVSPPLAKQTSRLKQEIEQFSTLTFVCRMSLS